MIWHAVSSLQRGAINPPERIEPAIERELNEAQDGAGRFELAKPMTVEQMWREQGYSAGYIIRKLRGAA